MFTVYQLSLFLFVCVCLSIMNCVCLSIMISFGFHRYISFSLSLYNNFSLCLNFCASLFLSIYLLFYPLSLFLTSVLSPLFSPGGEVCVCVYVLVLRVGWSLQSLERLSLLAWRLVSDLDLWNHHQLIPPNLDKKRTSIHPSGLIRKGLSQYKIFPL